MRVDAQATSMSGAAPTASTTVAPMRPAHPDTATLIMRFLPFVHGLEHPATRSRPKGASLPRRHRLADGRRMLFLCRLLLSAGRCRVFGGPDRRIHSTSQVGRVRRGGPSARTVPAGRFEGEMSRRVRKPSPSPAGCVGLAAGQGEAGQQAGQGDGSLVPQYPGPQDRAQDRGCSLVPQHLQDKRTVLCPSSPCPCPCVLGLLIRP